MRMRIFSDPYAQKPWLQLPTSSFLCHRHISCFSSSSPPQPPSAAHHLLHGYVQPYFHYCQHACTTTSAMVHHTCVHAGPRCSAASVSRSYCGISTSAALVARISTAKDLLLHQMIQSRFPARTGRNWMIHFSHASNSAGTLYGLSAKSTRLTKSAMCHCFHPRIRNMYLHVANLFFSRYFPP